MKVNKLMLEELHVISQFLNEICNGLNFENFDKKIGTNRENVEILLNKFIDIYDISKTQNSEFDNFINSLNDSERIIIKNCIDVVFCCFDESDFDNRLGSTKNQCTALRDKLIIN